MSCRLHRPALLDLARGVPQPAAALQAAEAHASACPACAAALRRQRDLTASLDALRADASTWQPPGRLEARLLEQAASQLAGSAPRQSPGEWRRRAAAAGLVAAAAVAALAVWMGGRERQAPAAPPSSAVVSLRPPMDFPPAGGGHETVPVLSGVTRKAPLNPKRKAPSASSPKAPAAPMEFITTPEFSTLPPLETASIVRLALDVSELPAYGVAIAPVASMASVEADLLVGQDGQVRGIRLVPADAQPPASRSSR